MHFTTVAVFALFAGAMAMPNAEADPRRVRPRPSNPSPNPAPAPSSGGTRRINKGDAAACVGAIGGTGANCGDGTQQQVEAAAANGGGIASCTFDAISAIPECKDLTSTS